MDTAATTASAEQLIAQLAAAVTNTSLYAIGHPQVSLYIDKAFALLSGLQHGADDITLLVIGDEIVMNSLPLSGDASRKANFIRILKRKGIERLSLVRGIRRIELMSLIGELAARDATTVHASEHVRIGRVEVRISSAHAARGATADASVSDEDMQTLASISEEDLARLKELYLSARNHRKIDVRGVDDIVRGFIRGFREELSPLSLLASIQSAHDYTYTHATNVCILTMSQAESLGFSGEHLHMIGVAALLHDVGKIFVPDEILDKPTKLTAEERAIIEGHAVKGARYLMGLEGIPKLAVLAALEHHRKYDGTGYPTIKGGMTPHITSQMIMIADAFDALRSKRAYQDSVPLDRVVEILRKDSGTMFNPLLVDHFLRLIHLQGGA